MAVSGSRWRGCGLTTAHLRLGELMITALATLNATDMFAAVTLLPIVGIGMVYGVTSLGRRLLHGSPEFRAWLKRPAKPPPAGHGT